MPAHRPRRPTGHRRRPNHGSRNSRLPAPGDRHACRELLQSRDRDSQSQQKLPGGLIKTERGEPGGRVARCFPWNSTPAPNHRGTRIPRCHRSRPRPSVASCIPLPRGTRSAASIRQPLVSSSGRGSGVVARCHGVSSGGRERGCAHGPGAGWPERLARGRVPRSPRLRRDFARSAQMKPGGRSACRRGGSRGA